MTLSTVMVTADPKVQRCRPFSNGGLVLHLLRKLLESSLKEQPKEELPDGIKKDFAETEVGQGKGCRSFTGMHIDLIEQNDGLWIARCSNWNVHAQGTTDLQAIATLWAYIKNGTFARNDQR